MEMLNLVLRWFHVLSAITMVGGVFYMRFAVFPLIESLPKDEGEKIGSALRRSWTKFIMISTMLLLVTGITNMILIPRQNSFAENANYGMLVGIKFMLALPVFYIVSLLNGRSKNAQQFRQKSRLWLNVATVLCVAIVLLAGYLRFIPRTAKSNDSTEAAAASFRSSSQTFFSSPTAG